MAQIAYCSNVHAGSNLAETQENLRRHALAVKELMSSDDPATARDLGVGLWLSDQTASQLMNAPAEQTQFEEFLATSGLRVFTFNGFPFGNFHQKVVKHDVFLPTWCQPERLRYTQNLVHLIDRFAPQDLEVSISTLPIAWGKPAASGTELDTAARQFAELADSLARLEQETGRLVTICIEPEPGCAIQYGRDIVSFFESHLLPNGNEAALRRHIRVCHDVCHAVVMCESQRDVLAEYQAAGIQVGKVQVSSAIWVDLDALEAADRQLALAQLGEFAEDRYLHQTTVQQADGTVKFFEDLPLALNSVDDPRQASGTWRIHFHVPIYLTEFGLWKASSQAIHECIACCGEYSDVSHFEVETYAWNVLPQELQQPVLAQGIAMELKWFEELAAKHGG